jgi:tetratricopeptide (TPR) repeat protein
VLSYAGRNQEALKEIDTALGQNSSDIAARLARADILARSDRTAEAVTAYNVILASDPNNVRAKTGLADAYLYGRRYNDAVRIYDGLIVAEPNNSNYKIQRARALGYAGRSKESVATLKSVVASEPNNLPAKIALAEVGINSGDATLQKTGIAQYRAILATEPNNVPAQLGLARGLSYVGSYKESKAHLNQILATTPDNVDARYALAETQRFEGNAFDARDNYERVLKVQPSNAQAKFGLAETRRTTASNVAIGGSYYSDSNGVRINSINLSPTLRTKALSIGAIIDRGTFKQNGVERDRNNTGISLGRQFGNVAANLAVSRLKYEGGPSHTLFDGNLLMTKGQRERYYAGIARRDVFESNAAVVAGITATTYRAGFARPIAPRLDLEGVATYYRYSDSNSRITLSPSLLYRFNTNNPSLRVGLGYTYDDTKENRPIPGGTLYYTPQRYSAASLLADYVVDSGPTRYGLYGALALTSSTGEDGVNRPADTLFGNFEHDLSSRFSVFANGGIVRSPDYRSNQVNGGVNVRF